MTITFLGYMGSGKSTLGEFLSKKIGFHFVDLDNYIEDKETKSIKQLFFELGEPKFRKLEHECLKEIFSFDQNTILCLGGGTPVFYDNMNLINQKSFSIYLYLSPEQLAYRLLDEKDKRPLISHLKNIDDLKDFIKKHLFERNPYYMQAKYVLNAYQKSIEELSEEVINHLKLTNE